YCDCDFICDLVHFFDLQCFVVIAFARSDWWGIFFRCGISTSITNLIVFHFRLFETHPECKDTFFLFRDVDDLQGLRMSKDLRAHGLRVLSFVEKSVARIENSSRLEELILELGKSHYRYNAPPQYYQYVGMEFISAVCPILKEKWTSEVEEVWKVLFRYICAVMEAGYREEEKHRNVKGGTTKPLKRSQTTAI
uniref:Globin domain-containing protein n=1 Tax=Leptobrachium leishanense TaxID=445787 RepID=A0A8C5R4N2_9ANUR